MFWVVFLPKVDFPLHSLLVPVLQSLFLGILLVPLRLLLMFLMLLLMWAFAALRFLGADESLIPKPVMGWRRVIPHHGVYWASRTMFFILGFLRIKVKGWRASPSEAPILVGAPHSSFFDALTVIPTDLPSVMSRAEDLKNPLMRDIYHFNQAILVSRQDPASRRKAVEEMKRRANQRGKWPQILVFPEGTCTNGRALIKFKPGAFIAGVPVQPLLIRYPNRLNTTSWTWKGPGMLGVFWMTLSQIYTNVEIEFLPVYMPKPEEEKDPSLFADNVQKVMADALGIPATAYEFEGRIPVMGVGHLKLPLEPGLSKLEQLIKKAGGDWGQIRNSIGACLRGKGWNVNEEEFAMQLKLPLSDMVRHIFSCYDQDKDGFVDWREISLGLAVLDHTRTTEELIDLASQEVFYDAKGKGSVTEEDFGKILRSLLGFPNLDVSKVFQEISANGMGNLTLDELHDFALSHPSYKKLFSSYLRRQHSDQLKHPIPNGLCSPWFPLPSPPPLLAPPRRKTA
uniref:Lysophosphatidylcholine acyltransferase 4 n=1 Tax=Latimeria chalumnae TaxID=7897 RepID=H2ZU27_LATCH